METTIYILTHKQFDYVNDGLHKPILNGSALLDDDFGYIGDDTGDNISKLNNIYSELTGEYWAWKNSKSDIIGFCHYRRYFAKNILLIKKIEKEDIEEILENYDIIMPQKRHLGRSVIEEIDKAHELGIPQSSEDYVLLRKIIAKDSPEYLESFDEFLENNECYLYNMYICKREILDDYFSWMFPILEKFLEQTDLSRYPKDNPRILGYLSERLINIYIKKHDLKVKEKYLYHRINKLPWISIIVSRFSWVSKLVSSLGFTQ